MQDCFISNEIIYSVLCDYESLTFESLILRTRMCIVNTELTSLIPEDSPFMAIFRVMIKEIECIKNKKKESVYYKRISQHPRCFFFGTDYLFHNPEKSPMYLLSVPKKGESDEKSLNPRLLFDDNGFHKYIPNKKLINILSRCQPDEILCEHNLYIIGNLFSDIINHYNEYGSPTKFIVLFPAGNYGLLHFIIGEHEVLIAINTKASAYLKNSSLYFSKELSGIHLLLQIFSEIGGTVNPSSEDKPIWQTV